MKLDLLYEKCEYMYFIDTHASASSQLVGNSQVFLDKIRWMDEHFRYLPADYKSILELGQFEYVQRVAHSWRQNSNFKSIDRSQNGLYSIALDYLYCYREQRKMIFPESDCPAEHQFFETKEPISENAPSCRNRTPLSSFSVKHLHKSTFVLPSKHLNNKILHFQKKKFRKQSPQTAQIQVWTAKKEYIPVTLPNGKRWTDIVSAFQPNSIYVLRKPSIPPPISNYPSLNSTTPLTKLVTPYKESKPNALLNKISAQIPTHLKDDPFYSNFFIWLLLEKNVTQSQAEDAVHLMNVCEDIISKLKISFVNIHSLEDIDELANYIAVIEENYQFQRIDQHFFRKISRALEWYYEFAAESASFVGIPVNV